MSKLFYINAHKVVRLCQVEIEASDEATAIDTYLDMAHKGEVDIDSFNWQDLSAGDLDVEYHGEVDDQPL